MKITLSLFFALYFINGQGALAKVHQQLTSEKMRDQITKSSSAHKTIKQSFWYLKKNYSKDFYQFFLNKLKPYESKKWPKLTKINSSQFLIQSGNLNINLDLKYFDLNQFLLNGKIIRFGSYNTPQEFLNDILQAMPKDNEGSLSSAGFVTPKIEPLAESSVINAVIATSLFTAAQITKKNCHLATKQLKKCIQLQSKLSKSNSRNLASLKPITIDHKSETIECLKYTKHISENFHHLKCSGIKGSEHISRRALNCYNNLSSLASPF